MVNQKRTKNNLFKKYVRNGRRYARKKQYSKALENYNRAIRLNPKSSETRFERAMLHEIQGREKEALEDYNKAIELNSRFSHAYNHRARLYVKQKKYHEALEDLKEVRKNDPTAELSCLLNEAAIYMRLEQYEEILDRLSKALALKPPGPMLEEIYWTDGVANIKLKKYKEALDDFNQAINLNPKEAALYVNRAAAYIGLDRSDDALKDLDKATDLNPKLVPAYLSKGKICRIKGQFEKALEAFRHVIELQPKNTEGYFQLAYTFEHLGQYDKALEEHTKVLDLNPNYAHVYTHIGIDYGNLCAYETSISNFSKAIKLDPKEDLAYLCRGYAYSAIGNYAQALADYERAIKLRPSSSDAYLGKGKALCYVVDEKLSFKERREYNKRVSNSFRKALETADSPKSKKLARWWIRFSKRFCDSSAENRKRLKIFAEIYEHALETNLFATVYDEKNRFTKFMSRSKTFSKTECFYEILRRWNSFTPVIPGKSRSNLGGGYFFACDGKGIVIDPGYDFIENFVESDFSLADIDIIVLTHAHDDHTADFEAILSLLSKSKENRKISLFTNLGASVKFSNLISKNESVIEKFEILNENQTYHISPNLLMKGIKTIHNDIVTETSSRGLIFELKRGSKKFKLGITGDTKLYSGVSDALGLYSLFENIDVLVLHIGSIHEREFETIKDNFEFHEYDGEHLGIRGIVNMIFRCRPKLAIISEFGEELKDLRSKMAYEIDDNLENYNSSGSTRVIPGDIGLRIIFENSLKVKCEVCGKLIRLKDVRYTETLINHKIAYHCRNHKRTEVINVFKREEERELRLHAESMGCTLDLPPSATHVTGFTQHKSK